MRTIKREEVVEGTAKVVKWWLGERLKKFRDLDHETMAINPFMAPLLMALHSHLDFGELGELLLAGHFMTGHATGFGKLIDEKLLPKVFGTTKLDKGFRKDNPVYKDGLFDEVDHLIDAASDDRILMSVKASRWTIQLTMASQINDAFAKLLEKRRKGKIKFSKIVVGVFYGKPDDLTDKYSKIIRGVGDSAKHGATDISAHVEVLAGREFWKWINGGEEATQEWIMEGILHAKDTSADLLRNAKELLEGYRTNFADRLKHHAKPEGIDWMGLLRAING